MGQQDGRGSGAKVAEGSPPAQVHDQGHLGGQFSFDGGSVVGLRAASEVDSSLEFELSGDGVCRRGHFEASGGVE